MRKSQKGTPSLFGGARGAVRNVLAPWGSPITKSTRSRGSTPRGSSTRRSKPDPSLRGMDYPPNDPLQWPIEVPAVRGDLPLPSGMTQSKADFNNEIVTNAFIRGGYAG